MNGDKQVIELIFIYSTRTINVSLYIIYIYSIIIPRYDVTHTGSRLGVDI